MKNILKILVLFMILGIALLTLTGCTKKIIAKRKYTLDTDNIDMKIVVEAIYNGEKIKNIKYIYEYADETIAKSSAEFSKTIFKNVKLEGATITIELSQEEYLKTMNKTESSDISQKDFINFYESQGYTIE